MGPLPDDEVGAHQKPSGAVVSLISVSFLELRGDFRDLVASSWNEALRRRAHELATVLGAACIRQGLPQAATSARSLAHLAALSRVQAIPLLPELRLKSEALLEAAQRGLAAHRRARRG